MRTKVIRRELCTGCKNCEMACIAAHSEGPALAVYLAAGAEGAPRPRAKVQRDAAGALVPQFCRHCKEPACVEACMSGALAKREDGLVLCDSDLCVGCYMCVMSCPYGNARPSMGPDDMMLKCDGCHDRDCMACVKACPTGCLSCEEGAEAVVYVEAQAAPAAGGER
ncbi:MAG: 4Fe-4S dicluster domain-containing protein [Planctomycetaceae bacterium]|nr:4Fe-4S binding protein [Planctomycetaceae bacterium]